MGRKIAWTDLPKSEPRECVKCLRHPGTCHSSQVTLRSRGRIHGARLPKLSKGRPLVQSNLLSISQKSAPPDSNTGVSRARRPQTSGRHKVEGMEQWIITMGNRRASAVSERWERAEDVEMGRRKKTLLAVSVNKRLGTTFPPGILPPPQIVPPSNTDHGHRRSRLVGARRRTRNYSG